MADGGWVITRESFEQDGSFQGIYAQAYNVDGSAMGDEVQVNTYVEGLQSDPQIAPIADGGLITWQSNGQDGDSICVYSRAFMPLDPDALSVALTGTQEDGETLTAELTGVDANDPTLTINYAWSVDGVVVAFENGSTFELREEYADQVVTVAVSVEDDLFGGNTTVSGTPTDPITMVISIRRATS